MTSRAPLIAAAVRRAAAGRSSGSAVPCSTRLGTAAELEAFAVLNTATALFVHNELTGGSARQQRNAAYLHHALATGRHPRLAELLAPAPPAQASPPGTAPDPADRYRDILARILNGLLGPEPPPA